jgi:hypothetical protein
MVKEHRLGPVAGGFQHEVRAVFPKQVRGLVDQVALLRQGSQLMAASRMASPNEYTDRYTNPNRMCS